MLASFSNIHPTITAEVMPEQVPATVWLNFSKAFSVQLDEDVAMELMVQLLEALDALSDHRSVLENARRATASLPLWIDAVTGA